MQELDEFTQGFVVYRSAPHHLMLLWGWFLLGKNKILYRMAVENIWKHAPERELIRVLHGKKVARTLLLIEEVRYQCD